MQAVGAVVESASYVGVPSDVRGLRDRSLVMGVLVRRLLCVVGVLLLVVGSLLVVRSLLLRDTLLLVRGLLVLGPVLLRVLLRGRVTLQRGLVLLLSVRLLVGLLVLYVRLLSVRLLMLRVRLLLWVGEVGVRGAGVLGVRARRSLVGAVGLRPVRTGRVRTLGRVRVSGVAARVGRGMRAAVVLAG
ncbi:hypothetical protein CP981_12720 [Streptomyces platensis]|uniref:Uncharacterized protein n=2 Tax=Streptomyces platensis TaxID=58346 RepID=A0AAE6TM86_STRPT|nr:hypothetical protein BG653_07344 [Streptomyces platensis]QEV52412.1 hypothetical protein CP981_12720 [Streptomyces platensis]